MTRRRLVFGLVVVAAAAAVGGLLASLSSTANETAVSTLAEKTHFHGITVDPSDPSRLYLATHHGLYIVGPDGKARRISKSRDDFMGFMPHPTDPAVLYASGHPAGGGNLGFMTSKDGGRTWHRVGQGAYGLADFHEMTMSAVDSNTIYGIYGIDLQVSHDAGRTWRVVAPIPDRIINLAASAEDVNKLFAASKGGLLYSNDGGKTWQTVFQDPTTVVEITPKGDALIFVIGRGLMRATESGLDWRTVSNEFGRNYIVHLAVGPSDERRIYAVTIDPQTRTQEIVASRDGGASWAPLGAN